jgi:methionyl-tRNA formyltransferase
MGLSFVFFGDGEWAAKTLDRLISDGHQPLAVVVRTNPSNDLCEAAARSHGVEVLQPVKASDPQFVEIVAGMEPEVCVSVSYDQIIRPALIDVPRKAFINCHAGKLPKYRGRNVVNWAIISGESHIGLTVHHIDAGVDSGDIILQRTFPILDSDDYGSVLVKLIEACPVLVSEVLSLIDSGADQRIPQDHSQATYYTGRANGDEWIDWEASSEDIFNKVRAITRPGPGATTKSNDRLLIVWKSRYDPGWPRYRAQAGAVIGISESGFPIVKTGDSTLELIEYEFSGSEEIKPELKIGSRLGPNMSEILNNLTNTRDQRG